MSYHEDETHIRHRFQRVWPVGLGTETPSLFSGTERRILGTGGLTDEIDLCLHADAPEVHSGRIKQLYCENRAPARSELAPWWRGLIAIAIEINVESIRPTRRDRCSFFVEVNVALLPNRFESLRPQADLLETADRARAGFGQAAAGEALWLVWSVRPLAGRATATPVPPFP